MANETLPISDIRDQLAHDLAQSAATITHRSDQIAVAASLMHERAAPVGEGSDDSEAQDAAEIAYGAASRIILLAVECAHESGKLLATSAAREQLRQRGEDEDA